MDMVIYFKPPPIMNNKENNEQTAFEQIINRLIDLKWSDSDIDKYTQGYRDGADFAALQLSAHCKDKEEWVSVSEVDKLIDMQGYWITRSIDGVVLMATYMDWGDDIPCGKTWIIGDCEYQIEYASHFLQLNYPSPPTK